MSAAIQTLERVVRGHPHPPEHHHVHFYEKDAHLHEVVAAFLAEGLRAGGPAVVIATAEHREAFGRHLEALGVDVDLALTTGQLVELDARGCLSRFMDGGVPDADRFAEMIGGVYATCRASFPGRVHAFGEMVDLLWRDGNGPAALRLEELWNDFGRDHPLSLLCAYVLGGFHKETHGDPFRSICDLHSHVFPTESFGGGDEGGGRLREIAALQQRARALQDEIEHRRELELALREALEERRRAEMELRASQEELLRQNEELQRTVRFSEMFVGILGHDLRNPLSAITTGASLLARRAESDKMARPVARILSSAGRMGRMIDQLLDFTRIRLGRGLPLERRRIDLAEVCRLTMDELETAGDARRIRFEVEGDPQGSWDGDRISQLVSNLLSNALAHGSDHGVVVLRVDGRHARDLVLEVHNEGVVPGEILPLLFEPFRSAANRKHERSQGLGLGLFISQQIALAHGGELSVVSNETEGTRIGVRLPRSPMNASPMFASLAR